jgi:hypothetical protein
VLLVGLVAGLLIAVLPEGAIPFVALAAAIAAGALLPASPMVAAVLVLVPTMVVAVVRAAIDDDRNVGALVVGLVSAVCVAAIVTHLSAGVVKRREQA